MATQLQVRRGTTAQMNAFTGAEGEIAVNTSTDTVHVHDGSTAGGFALAKADGSNIGTYAGSFTTLAASGAVTLSSTLAVTGTVTADGLTVANTSVIAGDFDGGTAATYIRLQDDTDNFLFGSNNSLGNFLIKNETADALRLSVANTGDISFYNSAGTSQSLFWDASAESLGIGTSSPSSQLEIDESGSGDATIKVGNAQNVYTTNVGKQGATAYGATAAGAAFLYTFNNDISIMSDGAAGSINFTTGGNTQKMVLTAAGNLLVGTSSAYGTNVLSVNGGIAIDGRNASTPGLCEKSDPNTGIFWPASDTLAVTTAGTERFRIAANGSISIPNQNAINELSFTGTEFTNVVSATTSGFQFGTTGAGYLALLTNNQPRATIDSVGNLLVGKTNTGDYVTGIEMQPAGAILSYRTSGVASIFGRTDSGEITRFTRGGAIIGSVDVDATGYIAINARTGTGRLQVGGVTRYNWDANQFYPQQDNVRDLGYPNLRWDDVYSTGGINTSDRNEKQDIEELSNAEQRVAVACKGLMRKFRWKSAVIDKGDDARIHVGIMAQDLQAAFESEGLDPARYGMWCSNTWTDEETGEEITRMSVRYNELLAFIISAT